MNSQAIRSFRCVREFLGHCESLRKNLGVFGRTKIWKKKCKVKKPKQNRVYPGGRQPRQFLSSTVRECRKLLRCGLKESLLLTAELSATLLPSAPPSDLSDTHSRL